MLLITSSEMITINITSSKIDNLVHVMADRGMFSSRMFEIVFNSRMFEIVSNSRMFEVMFNSRMFEVVFNSRMFEVCSIVQCSW